MDIIDFLEKNLCRYSDKRALVDVDNNICLTYKNLYDNILYYADYLKKSGIRENQKVGLYLNNSIIHIILLYSLLYLKAVPVLIDSRNTLREIKECLISSDTKVIIYENANFEINELYSTADKIFVIKESIEDFNIKDNKISCIIKNFNNDYNNKKLKKSKKLTYFILFTYRGTGQVLPVILSESAIINSLFSNFYLNKNIKDIILLLILPIHHIFALTCNLLSPLSLGVTIILTNKIQPYKILNIIEEYRITYLILVPTLVYVLLNSIKKNKYNLMSLRNGIVGGNKFQNDLYKDWHEALNCILLQGYGLTETCPVICNQWNNNKPGSIGKLMKGVKARLIDKNGNYNDKEGVLWIKSKMILSKYLNNEKENKEYIDNGWFNTGDIIAKDSDDFYYFIKTIKNIAKVGGSTVDLKEVKTIIQKFNFVHSCLLSVEHDKLWNDKIICHLTLRENIDKVDIYNYFKSVLASFKLPGNIIINSI
ncbi:MAG: acyl--CoA ligase [Spirochaetes bacterium]|nr:acyl--CoA ligase [Spirochaetota bacterium]